MTDVYKDSSKTTKTLVNNSQAGNYSEETHNNYAQEGTIMLQVGKNFTSAEEMPSSQPEVC